MAAALGPVAGIEISLLKGLQETADGNWARGLETMAPSVLRGPLKALRYAEEGVVDRSGKSVLADVDGLGIWARPWASAPRTCGWPTRASQQSIRQTSGW